MTAPPFKLGGSNIRASEVVGSRCPVIPTSRGPGTTLAPGTVERKEGSPMRAKNVLLEGATAGVIGAVMVAVWFLAYDLLRDTPLRTPSLLGAALFDGWSHAAPVETSTRLVIKYTIVHGLAFIVFGCALAGLFAIADRDFRFLFAIFMLLCCFQVAFLALLVVLA